MRSPMTRKPITVNDIVRLKDIVTESEMNRYKKKRFY